MSRPRFARTQCHGTAAAPPHLMPKRQIHSGRNLIRWAPHSSHMPVDQMLTKALRLPYGGASKTVGFLILWGKRHRRGIRELKCHRGGIAMTIADYIALGVLITLILLGAGRVYLETRRF